MELQGYAWIDKDADIKFSMGEKSDWGGKIVRVMEFNDDSQSVLCVSSCGTKMGMFDYKDIMKHFKCFEQGGILLPPTAISFTDKILEINRRLARKKDYNEDTRKLVVSVSLIKGEFTDEFLFK